MFYFHMLRKWISRLNTEYLCVFSPNTGKHEPEKTPYLDTFHAVSFTTFCLNRFKDYYWDIKRFINEASLILSWSFGKQIFRAYRVLNRSSKQFTVSLVDHLNSWQLTFYCVKDVRMRIFSDPYFPVMEGILSLHGKILIRENPCSGRFYAVKATLKIFDLKFW